MQHITGQGVCIELHKVGSDVLGLSCLRLYPNEAALGTGDNFAEYRVHLFKWVIGVHPAAWILNRLGVR